MRTIFEQGSSGAADGIFPACDVPAEGAAAWLGRDLARSEPPRIPNLSETTVARHYTRLSKLNYGVEDGMYPLGSCTMKYNPKLNEDVAALPGFANVHPGAEEVHVQGCLGFLYELTRLLEGIAGLPGVTLQPVAGAHGELTGMFLFRKHFELRGDTARQRILLPDSAHGTNPASAAVAGFSVTQIPSNARGTVDLEALRAELDDTVAGIMLTVPNTLGIFETDILEITRAVHEAGGLCYFDGANLNSFIGRARPGDMGADAFHFNLHKTLSTPHGGGGPGAGAVAVSERLVDLLPVPRVVKRGDRYALDWDRPKSIGSVHSFYGNVLVALKAYAYILQLGDEGLRAVSDNAVLNANYLQERLKRTYVLPYDRLCKHEFVLTSEGLADGVTTLDVAKRLIDYGVHPPTVYFPLIVHEALMIEPTETESKEELDRFAEILERIAVEAREHPDRLHDAPTRAPVRRLDQTAAARNPVFTFPFGERTAFPR
ncbi:MAG: aminomethyl-transferring glycine dehydrogenase subunit GcvPB [Candidatus Bipolaricaulia bacterium]